jgi:hypothetical protein
MVWYVLCCCCCSGRSGSVQVPNLAISGCSGKAVGVDVDASGAYASPALLTNITLHANSGTRGGALYIGPGAAATLQVIGCCCG